ncbi:glycoside hydrolase [Amylocarpus encephaloides]|uniref:Glycoside hydrolase n=1 Tax=Amylocarpus encephaloides TaxID=45428 RepID=A0A9P7YIR2_9HELO|nr:glycoside hydrolase [Amylocarpus encephaloides]
MRYLYLALAILYTSVCYVAGHGIVTGIVTNGTYHRGYDPMFQHFVPIPQVSGWSTPENTDYGFVPSSNFTSPDIICHKGATQGTGTINVKAGDTLQLQWNPSPWTVGHHGPVIDYLAACNGSCTTVDKSMLKFAKIAESGLVAKTPFPGYYGCDLLRDNNSTWTVWIPPTIISGEYILRHEILALHLAWRRGEAQGYPQCINLNVTDGGVDEIVGKSAQGFYQVDDPGVLIDIWQFNGTYVVPGPKVWEKSVAHEQPSVASGGT